MVGHQFAGNLANFVKLGMPVDYSSAVKFTQVTIVGPTGVLREQATHKFSVFTRTVGGIRGLSKRLVA